jgi:hypothetical protein
MSAVEAGLRPGPVQRGGVAGLVTSREGEPQINVTMANVLIPFPGAAVRDVRRMPRHITAVSAGAAASP